MKYPFIMFQANVEGHLFWVAKSSLLKGCVAQADSQEEALKILAENENAWLETAKEFNIPIPEVPIETVEEYSGKMTVRIAPSVHREAAMVAKREGISLNQYINDCIVARNSKLLVTP